jgi:hypothetical protein
MTDLLDALRILFLIVFVVFGNIIYLLIYNILTEKGQKMSGFKFQINNLLDFSDLIAKTDNAKEKRYFRILLRSFVVLLILFIGTGLTFFLDLKNMNCRDYENYLKRETQGQVTNKFIDTLHRRAPILTIQYDQKTFNNTDFSFGDFNFYDSIEIGDKIKKLRGDSIFYVTRGDRELRLIKSRKDFCKN